MDQVFHLLPLRAKKVENENRPMVRLKTENGGKGKKIIKRKGVKHTVTYVYYGTLHSS